MLRPDISQAISLVPTKVSEEIIGSCANCLEMLNAHLTADETVITISSAAPSKDGPTNSLLVLTDRRLLFVAPAPQALGWRLSTITRSQAYLGYFFIEAGSDKYSVGLESGWGEEFENQVKTAITVAVLADR